jgi:hypothetical protein
MCACCSSEKKPNKYQTSSYINKENIKEWEAFKNLFKDALYRNISKEKKENLLNKKVTLGKCCDICSNKFKYQKKK